MQPLLISEIFHSLQGETRTAGLPTAFVRLTGCPLRCGYCDTEYAFSGGKRYSVAAILDQVAQYKVGYVTVTGGEPLAQPQSLELLTALCDVGYQVSLETSGALDISAVDERVSRVVDLKTPGSGEQSRNLWANVDLLTPNDQLKFVICDRQDYDWAVKVLQDGKLHQRCEVLFSPVVPNLPPSDLADWIVADHLPVRFQMQLHKVLWGDEAGR